MGVEDLILRWEENANNLEHRLCVRDIGSDKDYTWSDIYDLVGIYKYKIQNMGLGSGDRIALLMPASIHWIAWVWACWASGVCFCPIIPSTAKSRIDYQLKSGDFHAIAKYDDLQAYNIKAEKSDKSAAYLIFTSGSSGSPKGVLVSYKGVEQVWRSQIDIFKVDQSSRWGWMLSPAFDASLSDIGVCLSAGASIFIAPNKGWLRYKSWIKDMNKHQITHIDAPPSWLALFYKKSPPKSLKVIVAGGESTPANILKAWSDKLVWINVYGPTETTICSSAQRRIVKDSQSDIPSTIGQAFKGITYKVVNPDSLEDLNPNEGELWIGGDCVALEYWRDEKLSDKSFVFDGNTRWFKTKDWVRQESILDEITNQISSQLVYVGRMDRQIKISGQLINLDEVESVLSKSKGVDQIRVDTNERGQIIAYYLDETNLEEMKIFAKDNLPLWGNPSFWICVDSWESNQNGKIDRSTLRLKHSLQNSQKEDKK